ncbi:glycosyltransferase family 4 protein [Microbacterium alcoholitolerans]|uniref:glycosyltransferase family 4 protein n=1 Tax=unclassified Microbacterium TaxID=2609290 RepID=UPI003D17794D
MRSVCFVVTADRSAGFLSGYLQHLRLAGWEVTLIANDDGNLARVGREEGVNTIAIAMRRNPSPLQDLVSMWRMFRILRALHPDALIYATPKASMVASITGKLNGIPVRIYELWGLRYETERGIRRLVYRAVERIIGSCSTEVVAVSHSLATLAQTEGVARRVHVVGEGSALGVDTERFSPDAVDMGELDARTNAFLSEHRTLPRVLFVGRINRDKGLDTLVEALKLLIAEDRPVAVMIVGAYESDTLRALLDSVTDALPIHVVGPTPDPRPYMRAARVLCLPTLREGFGQVIIEAAAMGVPAVTTNATGARDAVVNEVTGLVVPMRDPRTLADAIWRLATEQGLAERLGAAARERALATFSKANHVWQIHAEHLEESVEAELAARAQSG